MALVLKDRVKETAAATAGTGTTYTGWSRYAGFQSFSVSW